MMVSTTTRGQVVGVILLMLTMGCSGAQEPAVTEASVVADEGIEDVPDDTCHWLQECWDLDEFADTDGCPTEPEIGFATGSSELPGDAERGLAEIVVEIGELGERLRRLRLAGYAAQSEAPDLALARALAVQDSLIARGVSPDILETTGEQHGERGYVAFVVLDCDPITSK